MGKSFHSKASGYSSIMNGTGDQNVQILKISLKKQMDRKQKLQKLMQKYECITHQQKQHIKSIKASIIQMKDLQAKSKTKFFLNPIIYVNNRLSKQTREYLCILLNSFYSKYQQNFQYQFKTRQLNTEMNQMLEVISKNQQTLLKKEKETIGQQMQLQGELLTYKNRLKEQANRMKAIQVENDRVTNVCQQYEAKYTQQLEKVDKLRQTAKAYQDRIALLKQQVAQGELVKKGKEQTMANEITYQQKFRIQLSQFDSNIAVEKQRQKELKRKLKQHQVRVSQLKSKLLSTAQKSQEQISYETQLKILSLKSPNVELIR